MKELDAVLSTVVDFAPLPGLFTLILAAIFPSNSNDRFTLSKLLAVFLR